MLLFGLVKQLLILEEEGGGREGKMTPIPLGKCGFLEPTVPLILL